jgi:hypothetical protein
MVDFSELAIEFVNTEVDFVLEEVNECDFETDFS